MVFYAVMQKKGCLHHLPPKPPPDPCLSALRGYLGCVNYNKEWLGRAHSLKSLLDLPGLAKIKGIEWTQSTEQALKNEETSDS